MEGKKAKILLCEDDPNLGSVLKNYLELNDYDVTLERDGRLGLAAFQRESYDLCLLDVMMPNMDGFTLAEEIRDINPDVPLFFLSAKTMKEDIIQGYKLGADDYITKPFGIDELLARIRAALRRAPLEETEIETSFEAGDFRINAETHQVFVRQMEVHLTPKEFDLLLYLVKNREKVLTHRTLLSAIWGDNFTEQPEYLRVFMGNLRKKIEQNPSEPRYILTEPWVGYRFNP